MISTQTMRGSSKFRQAVMTTLFLVINIVRTSLEKQFEPMGQIASRRLSVPVFIRKPLATCDFPVGKDPDPFWVVPPVY